MPNNSNNNNNTNTNTTTNKSGRGRFLLGRRSALRKKANRLSFRKPAAPQQQLLLSPLHEETTQNESAVRLQPPPPVNYYSKSPIATQETVDATGFSKAELYDLEESFKLFDVYGEGNVQVGDLKGILEVLQQEEQQNNEHTTTTKYSNLELLLDRLSELEDEDTLDLEDYVRLMASTTIGNSIAIDNHNNNSTVDSAISQDQYFARVFALFDSSGKGYISLQDLEQIAVELGEHDMTRGELQEMMDRAVGGNNNNNNSNGNNSEKRVGLEDFTRMMTMSLFSSPNE